MKIYAYSHYKSTDIRWLGSIPVDWSLVRFKFLCKIQTGDKDTVNAVEDGEYPFFVRSQQIERINSYSADCEAVLTAGDGVGVGKVFHYYTGKFDFHQRVYMFNQFKSCLGKFVYYYLKSNFFKVALEGNAKSTVDSLRLPLIQNFEFSLPSLDEQTQIAAFLDRETAKIDRLIEKQQRLINLLGEKRQAVISHAVTKGLNPDVSMKNSGVEWLGEVPEHWLVAKIKHLVSTPVTDGPHETPEFLDEGIPFVSAEAVATGVLDFRKIRGCISESDHLRYSKKYKPKLNDIFMIKSGATTGVVAIVDTELDFNIWSPLAVVRCRESISPFFTLHFMRSSAFQEAIELNWSFGTQQNIGMGVIENLPAAIPPLDEAIEIANYIQRITGKINRLTVRASDMIDLLKERRTALIYAAVTGKIDVRNQVPQDVEEAVAS